MDKDKFNNEEMRMEDFESMLEDSLKQPARGSVVKGVVAQISGNDVIVNFGYKTEGVVNKSEVKSDIKVGDKIDLVVVGFSGGGYIQLSRRAIDDRDNWEAFKDASGAEKPVKVKIEAKVDKGYRGKIGDIEAFIPENHIDLKSRITDPNEYVGKTLTAKVLKLSGGGKRKSALVSPKMYMLEQQSTGKKEFFDKIKVGETIKGTVKTLKDYGAFISFGSVDGFLHKSNLVWGRPKNPAKYIEENQEIEVVVLEINPEQGKIEVGLKQLTIDPWSDVKTKFPVDSIITANVIGRRRNGYVAEIESGIDAFIPLEEISWLRNTKASLNAKDQVEGRVLEYDDKHKRITISVRLMNENPWKTLHEEVSEGSVVEGTIKNITDFGLFVDFGQFVDGLVRKGDISWTDEPADLTTAFKAGDKIKAKVLKIDEERERVSLGIKQLEQNPWKDLSKPATSAKGVDVTISAVTKTGLEVTLANGIKGVIAQNELDPELIALDNYKVGDTITATIIKADPKDKTVLLSVKRLLRDSERKETKEYMKRLEKSEDRAGFGAIFKDKLNKD